MHKEYTDVGQNDEIIVSYEIEPSRINEAELERLLFDDQLRRIAYKEKEIAALQNEVEEMKNTLEPEEDIL
jgi:hypothetical protein